MYLVDRFFHVFAEEGALLIFRRLIYRAGIRYT